MIRLQLQFVLRHIRFPLMSMTQVIQHVVPLNVIPNEQVT